MIRYFLFSVLLLLLFSCSKEEMSFEIGNRYLDSKTNIRFFDTLTIHSSTVMMDSIQTSGLDVPAVVVGSYYDPEFGRISANGYFRVSLPSVKNLPRGAVYDSIKLFLVYNDYYAGDTLKDMTINVHRLKDKINADEYSSQFLYNKSSLGFYPEIMGSLTFKPRPLKTDTVWIGLSNEFGQELFNLLEDKEIQVEDNANFLNYLKGFRLSANNTDEAIIGFKYPAENTSSGDAKNPALRLYYHYTQFEYKNAYLDFNIGTFDASQFNQFLIDDEAVSFPEQQAEKVPASQYEGKSYVMAGLGVVTRFEIPYLKNLNSLHENVKIINAVLQIEPLRNTYKQFGLPEQICLYTSDGRNRFMSAITNSKGITQYANLTIDYVDQIETWYTFDVTSFLQSGLKDNSDETPSLLLTIPPDNLYKTVDRLVLGSQMNSTNKVTLKVYYMIYE
ncbi:MAG: DUF4270 family protein [Bacteroidales bacterium]|nr:DUF4270 family protein [Bacteroidales bacterium]